MSERALLPFLRPADVPRHVDAETARANIARGRPTTARTFTVTVDGASVPVLDDGEGAAVLCVHGLGHDASDWGPLFARRPDGVRLLALDLPGFGLAGLDAPRFDLGLLVRAVEAVVRALDAPCALVGSSLGGHVALLAALRKEVPLTALVLAAPGGLVDVSTATAALARAYYSEAAIQARSDEEIVRNSQRIFADPARPECGRLAAKKLAVHRSPLKAAYARPFAAIVDDVFRHPLAREVGHVDVPFLIIHGGRDVVVERAPLVRAVDANPRARFLGLDDEGHLPMVEAADTFARATFSFLDGARGDARAPTEAS